MNPSRCFSWLALALAVAAGAGLAGCATRQANDLVMRESFSSTQTYSRSVAVTPDQACEAGRRALLSQGYVVGKATADTVEGSKNFQPKDDMHEQLDIRLSCMAQDAGHSWVFASALRDRYALKKNATSASVGVSVLGSISLPVGSSDDSLVKVASSTIQDATFYDRLFDLVESYLPGATPPETPAPAPAAPDRP